MDQKTNNQISEESYQFWGKIVDDNNSSQLSSSSEPSNNQSKFLNASDLFNPLKSSDYYFPQEEEIESGMEYEKIHFSEMLEIAVNGKSSSDPEMINNPAISMIENKICYSKEELLKEIWDSKQRCEETLKTQIHPGGFYTEFLIRVKKLDASDIEDCGYIFTNEGWLSSTLPLFLRKIQGTYELTNTDTGRIIRQNIKNKEQLREVTEYVAESLIVK